MVNEAIDRWVEETFQNVVDLIDVRYVELDRITSRSYLFLKNPRCQTSSGRQEVSSAIIRIERRVEGRRKLETGGMGLPARHGKFSIERAQREADFTPMSDTT